MLTYFDINCEEKSMDTYIGQILMVAFNFAPDGWALCNGQLLSINQYSALFSLLGTVYGGDGQNNFALPNLQGRVPIHMGQGAGLSPYEMGDKGGIECVTLLNNQIPSHRHTFQLAANSSSSDSINPTNRFIAPTTVRTNGGFSATSNTSMALMTTNLEGGQQPHSNIQPYLTVNFIIALQGIFPSR
jgi:microcystin-dependent protein